MGLADRLRKGLEKSREALNQIFYMGGEVDEQFWEDLEDTLVMGDIGPEVAMKVVDDLRELSARQALRTADQMREALAKRLAEAFPAADRDPFDDTPSCVIFVGINGAGKTTTVGKLAGAAREGGTSVLIGGADTFRAAAIEQLKVWGDRSGVEVVTRERGADPASVCYDVVERAEQLGSDLVLIDTSGRLHTSDELMRELQKVVNVTRKRADVDVKTVLVIDATTGQNGLQQAREFDKALDLDGVIMTKLDGTAKGGIAVAVSHELGLPIVRVGVGEGIEDLQPFDAREYAEALFGEMRDEVEGKDEPVPVVDTCPGTGEGRLEDVEEAPEVETDEELVEAEAEEEVAEAETEPETDDEECEDGVEIWLEVDDGSEDDEVDEFEDEPAFDKGDADDEIDAEPVDEDDSEPAKESFRDKMRRWFS